MTSNEGSSSAVIFNCFFLTEFFLTESQNERKSSSGSKLGLKVTNDSFVKCTRLLRDREENHLDFIV